MKYEIEEWPDGKCRVLVHGKYHEEVHPTRGYLLPVVFDSANEAKDWIDQHAASRPRRYEYTPKSNA